MIMQNDDEFEWTDASRPVKRSRFNWPYFWVLVVTFLWIVFLFWLVAKGVGWL